VGKGHSSHEVKWRCDNCNRPFYRLCDYIRHMNGDYCHRTMLKIYRVNPPVSVDLAPESQTGESPTEGSYSWRRVRWQHGRRQCGKSANFGKRLVPYSPASATRTKGHTAWVRSIKGNTASRGCGFIEHKDVGVAHGTDCGTGNKHRKPSSYVECFRYRGREKTAATKNISISSSTTQGSRSVLALATADFQLNEFITT